jgi:transposase
MSRRKRTIELSEPERITLREGSKHHPKHEFRIRCQALLLSGKGWSVKAIAHHLEVGEHAVSYWFTHWENQGLVGLMRQTGQGRKPKLSVSNQVHQQTLAQAVGHHYQDIARIKAELEASLGFSMSVDTVKRFLKKTITLGTASDVLLKRGKTR